jgi:ketol-acid reductoisomerase
MAKVYRDNDVDLGVLDGKTVAILGYGNQGRSQALNLRDNGVSVVVGNRGDEYRQLASDDGFDAFDIPTAASKGDVAMVILPDETHAQVLPVDVFPHLKPGATLVFAHGYSVFYKEVDPPEGHDVTLLAPKMIGPAVRELFTKGAGFPSLIAVERDSSGQALATVLALAKGIGSTKLGAWETTFEEETITDLFGEQVGGGGAIISIMRSFKVLTDAGYDPEVVQLEMLGSGELVEVIRSQWREGVVEALTGHSPTSQFGQLHRAEELQDSGEAEQYLKGVLDQLQDGSFADLWRKEQESGYARLEALRAKYLADPFCDASRRNREELKEVIEKGIV